MVSSFDDLKKGGSGSSTGMGGDLLFFFKER